MQSGQGFAFGKTLVTRHLARLKFTKPRPMLKGPSHPAKAVLIYKISLTEFAAPQRREKYPIRFLRRRVRRKKHFARSGVSQASIAGQGAERSEPPLHPKGLRPFG